MARARRNAGSGAMRPRMRLGDFLVAYLRRAGVRHIFGLPGDLVLGLFQRFGRSRDLDIVTFSHEPSVGFAADGYARSTRRLGEQYPAQTHKISMTVDLPADPDAMWTGFKSSHRQDIRKAANAGFVARHGGRELLAPFYAILSESWRDLGTPFYGRRYFDALFDE